MRPRSHALPAPSSPPSTPPSWAPNCAEWVVLQFAAAQAGTILVNLNPALRAAELQYALDKCDVSVLVLTPELKGTSFVDMVVRLQQEGGLPALRHTVVLGEEEAPGATTW